MGVVSWFGSVTTLHDVCGPAVDGAGAGAGGAGAGGVGAGGVGPGVDVGDDAAGGVVEEVVPLDAEGAELGSSAEA